MAAINFPRERSTYPKKKLWKRRNSHLMVIICSYLVFLALVFSNLCGATDVITSTQFIQDPGSLVSHGSTFKLGFFSPSSSNSTSRYLGIWFNNISVITPAWVANRDNPLNGSSGVLTISTDGNLVVLDEKGGTVVWSSNLTGVQGANRSAKLTDDGDLVLQDVESGKSVWESAQTLADTLLQSMRLSSNPENVKRVELSSWRSDSDPSIGSFTCGIDLEGIPEGFIWKDGVPYWRSGPWVGQIFIGISMMNTTYLDGYNLAKDKDGSYSLSLSNANKSTLRNLVLDWNGQLRERMWNGGKAEWEDDWRSYTSECDVFGKCGEFGFCNPQDSPICSCLAGFEPRNQQEWNSGNWSSGCVRRKQLQCERESKNGSKQDGFLRLHEVKVPYLAQWIYSLDDASSCRDNCLNCCSCSAYSFYPGFGCMSWSSNLVDIQQFRPRTGGTDLYLRLAFSELGQREDMKVVIIILPVVLGAIVLTSCAFFLWKWRARHRECYSEMKKRNELDDLEGNGSSQMDIQELPVFDIRKLVSATDNFHPSNKLGEGGFGPVYKGILSDGSEIAVKRLSRSSGQGLEEFMNEVMLISKLQHRNLVRLLGCCVEGETMLVYEYMPNKSLDGYLFGDTKIAEPLDWPTRFKIIEGICRGLLYLHRDSRLRIIHRDMKPSNILLDQELNPKISDFGMARIFGGNEDQANTRRVAGTYGYMSPEYVIRGRFSEKSDVFSLGVIVLEIVSGRRNTSFGENDQAPSLLGYAWKLWTEDNISALIHPVASHPQIRNEVRRCIHVGLLCVQDLARDRPVASTVMSMLSSEIQNLPTPTQPAFTESLIRLVPEPLQPDQGGSSGNRVTITSIEGR